LNGASVSHRLRPRNETGDAADAGRLFHRGAGDLPRLRAGGDPGCSKIRADVLARVKALAARQHERNRAFDKVEMSKGGNVHQLILGLVNGG
jgi:predicted secreted Zn-dependent protease